MAKKGQIEEALDELKKLYEPFVDIYKVIKRYRKRTRKYRAYKQQQREIRKIKLKRGMKWVYDKITKNDVIFMCDKCGTEVSKDAVKCPNCDVQFEEKIIETAFMCSNCHRNIEEKVERCPYCGALFIEKRFDKEKREIIDALDKNIRREDFEKLTKEELAIEINNIIELMKDLSEFIEEYVSDNCPDLEPRKLTSYQNKIKALNEKANVIERKVNKGINKAQSLMEYNKIIAIYYQQCKLHKEVIGVINGKLSVVGTLKYSKTASIVTKKKDEEYSDNLDNQVQYDSSYEKDREYYEDDNSDDVVYDSLEDWQKKEVDEGNYDSYNFEEEELEEDDYYYEDDDE